MKQILFILSFLYAIASFAQVEEALAVNKQNYIIDTIVAEIYIAESFDNADIRFFVSTLDMTDEEKQKAWVAKGSLSFANAMYSQVGYIIVEMSGPEIKTDIENILGYFNVNFDPIKDDDVYNFYMLNPVSFYR